MQISPGNKRHTRPEVSRNQRCRAPMPPPEATTRRPTMQAALFCGQPSKCGATSLMRPQNPAIRVDLPPAGRPPQKVSQNRLSSGGIKIGATRTCSQAGEWCMPSGRNPSFSMSRHAGWTSARSPEFNRSSIRWLMMAWPVIVISSHLPEIMDLSDRILVTRQGRMAEEFTARQERINICSGALKFYAAAAQD